ncbi:hypothetical protein FA13DRAFT_1724716 [Coprinellus micaceus]|uniref:Uncharacterized protein n=1 Tax=Coprinellus micaceus TaxID=71717 RepID=A0A4Y7TX75_COPMI|nr:hypothetical protein FA13DRAFT_1724716 [Coprinellus micaceus]
MGLGQAKAHRDRRWEGHRQVWGQSRPGTMRTCIGIDRRAASFQRALTKSRIPLKLEQDGRGYKTLSTESDTDTRTEPLPPRCEDRYDDSRQKLWPRILRA